MKNYDFLLFLGIAKLTGLFPLKLPNKFSETELLKTYFI